jgi:choline dehydrogenase-like flavoprotein
MDLFILASIPLKAPSRKFSDSLHKQVVILLTFSLDRLGIYYPRGATVGGSMVANAMNFMMPPDSNWEYIAELTGDDSWNPQQMREYFIELERNVYLEPGSPEHGFDGYITVGVHRRTSYRTLLTEKIVQ